MKTLPKDWYIEVTGENSYILNRWRQSVATALESSMVRIGYHILSKHYLDGTFYSAAEDESTLLKAHPGYVKIDLETFLQITQMEPQTKTHTIKWHQAQDIIDIACNTWKNTLFNMWGKDIVLKNKIDVSESDYESMRHACTPPQHELFDTIFGKQQSNLKVGEWVKIIQSNVDRTGDVFQLNESHFDVSNKHSDITYDGAGWKFPTQVRLATEEEINTAKYPKDGTPCLVRAYLTHGWELRYANGKGEFYNDGKKSGFPTHWNHWMVLDVNNLPVN